MGRKNITRVSRIRVLKYYYKVVAREWLGVLRRRPTISVFAFIKYYLKILVLRGFDKKSKFSARLHSVTARSNFIIFLQALDYALFFWRRRQNFFNLALVKNKIVFNKKYKEFISTVKRISRFSTQFFTSFYRLYLLSFRQSKFFRFMLFTLTPIFSSLGFLPTKLEFFGIDNVSISSYFLAKYMARKIEMRFQLKDVFNPVSGELKYLMRRTSKLLGYKFQFVGRLTRRGKVRTTWHVGGSIPTSKVEAQIEHAFYVGILRNGVCCVRV